MLFTVELDRRYARDGIQDYAVHPGVVGTKPNASAGGEALRLMGLIDVAGQPIIDPVAVRKTPQRGAGAIVIAATSPLLAGICPKDNDIATLDDENKALTADQIPSDPMAHSPSFREPLGGSRS